MTLRHGSGYTNATRRTLNVVIAGLDPAIHHFELNQFFDGCAGQPSPLSRLARA
jgi:hypothetical protein